MEGSDLEENGSINDRRFIYREETVTMREDSKRRK